MSKVFKIDGASGDEKDVFVSCTDGDLRITIDWDDVDKTEALALLKKMLAVLNDNWSDTRYDGFQIPRPIPPEGLDEDALDDWHDKQYARTRAECEKFFSEAGEAEVQS